MSTAETTAPPALSVAPHWHVADMLIVSLSGEASARRVVARRGTDGKIYTTPLAREHGIKPAHIRAAIAAAS